MTSLLFDHLTDKLLILSTIALTWYTAKAAHETARQVHDDDVKLMKLMIRGRRNRNAKHARRQDKDNVRRIS